MNAAYKTQTIEDEDVMHRQQVVARMRSETFKNFFNGEFGNLRKAISDGDKAEIKATIEALEACAVNVCEQFDEAWEQCQ